MYPQLVLPRIHDERDTRKDLLGEVDFSFYAIISEFLRLMSNTFYLRNIGTVDENVWL
jgi:hypothetical protein